MDSYLRFDNQEVFPCVRLAAFCICSRFVRFTVGLVAVLCRFQHWMNWARPTATAGNQATRQPSNQPTTKQAGLSRCVLLQKKQRLHGAVFAKAAEQLMCPLFFASVLQRFHPTCRLCD